jgi:hypothetical protein
MCYGTCKYEKFGGGHDEDGECKFTSEVKPEDAACRAENVCAKDEYSNIVKNADNFEVLPGMKAYGWMEDRKGSAANPVVLEPSNVSK